MNVFGLYDVRFSKFLDKHFMYFVHFEYYTGIFRIFWTGVSNFTFGKIFGKFCQIFGHSKTGVLYRTCLDRQKSDNVEIPGKLKGQNFLPNAWP